LIRALPWAAARLMGLANELRRPDCRPVRWVIAIGFIVSAVAGGVLELQGLRGDGARFHELGARFAFESEMFGRDLEQLLLRSREWWRQHPDANNAEWESWLDSEHYPGDYPGVLGIGCATQVLAGQVREHENEWTARNGFAYRLRPEEGTPRVPAERLTGDLRLPVVLYVARELDKFRWLTNQTILGQDLLFQTVDDQRSWSQARRIEQSLAENELRASSVETIAPAAWYGREQKGLRLFLPLVSRPLTAAGRLAPEAWQGVVFANVDFEELVRIRLQQSPPQLGFRISTGDAQGGRYDVLVDTGSLDQRAAAGKGGFQHAEPVSYYRDTLWIDLWTTELFAELSPRRWTRWIAAAGFGASLLMAALLLGQIRARTKQGKLLAELRDANHRLDEAARDRGRLSRDLHDGTIQSLYAVGLHLQHAQRHLTAAPEKAAHGLEDGRHLVQDTIVELRQFLLALQDERGTPGQTFGEAMESLLPRLRRTTPVEFDLEVAPAAGALPARVVLQLVNVVRECLSNALRHGRPGRIGIALRRGAGIYCLEVSDDGQGFEPAKVAGGGFGLRTLRERAAELGGTLAVTSAPGHGASVRLEFPETS
jgi:signal transduction histidine kinase